MYLYVCVCVCVCVCSVECVLADSDCENPVADKRAPGSERAAERRLAPLCRFIYTCTHAALTYSVHKLKHIHTDLCINVFQAFDYEKRSYWPLKVSIDLISYFNILMWK